MHISTETKAKPLGCMSDALASASASFEVLQRQLNDCTNAVEQLQRVVTPSKGMDHPTLSTSVTAMMVRKVEMSYLVNFLLIFYFLFNHFFYYFLLLSSFSFQPIALLAFHSRKMITITVFETKKINSKFTYFFHSP